MTKIIKEIKSLILFSTIAILGGCETINQASQCDPEKNYLISNPEAIKKYEDLKNAGKISSFYFESVPAEPCYTDVCITYDSKDIKFYERKFKDNERDGIYKISVSPDLNNINCIKKDPSNPNNNCYLVEKNLNNEVMSQYKLVYDRSETMRTKVSFINIKSKEVLYEKSYQTYLTKALGGPGIATCKLYKNENNLKIDVLNYPTKLNN